MNQELKTHIIKVLYNEGIMSMPVNDCNPNHPAQIVCCIKNRLVTFGPYLEQQCQLMSLMGGIHVHGIDDQDKFDKVNWPLTKMALGI